MSTRCTAGLSGDGTVHVYTECFDENDLVFVQVETADFSCSPGEVVVGMKRKAWDEAINAYIEDRKRQATAAARVAIREARCVDVLGGHKWGPGLFEHQQECAQCDKVKGGWPWVGRSPT